MEHGIAERVWASHLATVARTVVREGYVALVMYGSCPRWGVLTHGVWDERKVDAVVFLRGEICVEDVEEVEVMQIKLENDTLWYMAKGKEIVDEDWQNLSDDVISGNLDMLYDAVYAKIEEEMKK